MKGKLYKFNKLFNYSRQKALISQSIRIMGNQRPGYSFIFILLLFFRQFYTFVLFLLLCFFLLYFFYFIFAIINLLSYFCYFTSLRPTSLEG